MAGRCPGQDGRNLSVSIHKCPTCGSEVEMFSDEVRVRCRECRTWVEKDAVPTCVEWCSQARECLGEARWQALMGSRATDAEDTRPDGSGDGEAGSENGEAGSSSAVGKE